jgi:ribosome biogenesis GTPase A
MNESDLEEESLRNTENDIELFKQQLGVLDIAVSNTEEKLDRIQEILDKVVENLRLGKPIEPYPSTVLSNDVVSEDSQEACAYEDIINSDKIFDRNELLDMLKRQKIDQFKNPPRLCVGMIGYPNVGKSSSVNVLMQTKKVSTIYLK